MPILKLSLPICLDNVASQLVNFLILVLLETLNYFNPSFLGKLFIELWILYDFSFFEDPP